MSMMKNAGCVECWPTYFRIKENKVDITTDFGNNSSMSILHNVTGHTQSTTDSQKMVNLLYGRTKVHRVVGLEFSSFDLGDLCCVGVCRVCLLRFNHIKRGVQCAGYRISLGGFKRCI